MSIAIALIALVVALCALALILFTSDPSPQDWDYFLSSAHRPTKRPIKREAKRPAMAADPAQELSSRALGQG